jgi:hypothetical protein
MLDGVDVAIACSIIELPLLVLHSCWSSQMIVRFPSAMNLVMNVMWG